MTIDYSKYEGHTAGPWEGCGMVVRARIGKWGRALLDLYHRETEAETLANRNLIADAPLLLKRCRELEAAIDLFTPIERPTSEGWYWFRWSRDRHEWNCVPVVRDEHGYLWALESNRPGDEHAIENMSDGEWRGPIPMPPK